jgi:predicted metal-dependent hydrolase
MTHLHIRRIDFGFDDTTPFQWLPSHPKFGLMANAISIMAIAFEKFIVINTRAAIPLIRDPEAAEEAEAFLRQEAQHATALAGRFVDMQHATAVASRGRELQHATAIASWFMSNQHATAIATSKDRARPAATVSTAKA